MRMYLTVLQHITVSPPQKKSLQSPHLGGGGGKGRKAALPPPRPLPGTVLGESVLVVKAGNIPLTNLLQPIKLTFKYNIQVKLQNRLCQLTWKIRICYNVTFNMFQVGNGTCVFWQESGLEDGTGGMHTACIRYLDKRK